VLTTSSAKYEVRSDVTGRFEFVGLPPAEYAIETSLPGFAPLKEAVTIAGHTVRDLTLRVGSLEETITVTDRSVPLATPDAATLQQREASRRRYAEMSERERARCAADGAASPVGGRILPPAKLRDVRPLYPEHLRDAKVGGVVTMDAVVDKDGRIRDVQNLKGPEPALEVAAADAVRQWQFSTTLLNCEPIAVEMHVTTYFSIQP
jgi:TonB family protein